MRGIGYEIRWREKERKGGGGEGAQITKFWDNDVRLYKLTNNWPKTCLPQEENHRDILKTPHTKAPGRGALQDDIFPSLPFPQQGQKKKSRADHRFSPLQFMLRIHGRPWVHHLLHQNR